MKSWNGKKFSAALAVFFAISILAAFAHSEKITGTATQDEISADAARMVKLGARYNPDRFEGFPSDETPFADWRRINTKRLSGSQVYVYNNEIRIWKTMFCGDSQDIYIELSLLTREGKKIPFAWQECSLGCGPGGFCQPDNALFVDITGNGKPEIKFPDIEGFVNIKRSLFKNTRYNFSLDFIPLWVKRIVGPNFSKLSTVGPGDSVGYWQDHPLTVEDDRAVGF